MSEPQSSHTLNGRAEHVTKNSASVESTTLVQVELIVTFVVAMMYSY